MTRRARRTAVTGASLLVLVAAVAAVALLRWLSAPQAPADGPRTAATPAATAPASAPQTPPAPRRPRQRDRAEAPRARAQAARPRPDTAGDTPCVVARVSDGDTIRCAEGVSVRLLLIDTPELGQRPFGQRARAALAELAPVGSEVRLEHDVRPTDRYGRQLAYVYGADGTMLNEEMARRGYALALVYPPNVRHVERIRAAVEDARRARRGLHSTEAFSCPPREFRRGACGAPQAAAGGADADAPAPRPSPAPPARRRPE